MRWQTDSFVQSERVKRVPPLIGGTDTVLSEHNKIDDIEFCAVLSVFQRPCLQG